MGLLSNRVAKGSLKPGDHIYSWRTAYIYAHHGIYIGDDKVIHFTRHGQEVGTETVLDVLMISSGPARSQQPCDVCTPREENSGVLCSCLNCFLSGGVLYRFEYAVNPALFLAKARGGTCTLALSDPDDMVVHRAKYLLEKGFGCYRIFKNNCEDFAIYCKTGLCVSQRTLGLSGQVASIIGGPLATILTIPLSLVTTNVYGMVAVGIVQYCANRYSTDIGKRKDVVKVSVEEMTRRLAAALRQVVEAQISAPLLQLPESQMLQPPQCQTSAPLLQAPQCQTSAPSIQVPQTQIPAPPTRGYSNLFFWSKSSSNLVSR